MNLLDILIIIPFLGFLVLLFLPRENKGLIRMAGLVIALAVFVASLGLIGPMLHSGPEYQFVTDVPWISYPAINYHIGLDGISLWLVILSTLLTPIAMLISWNSVQDRVKEFFAFLLLLEFGLIGVFVALDLFLFYTFWEICLVPMYFLIGIWGHDRRIYAAVKFFLYTMAGSVLMLAAIVYLYNKTGSFDYPLLLNLLSTGKLILSHTEQTLLFLAFFFAFAIKVPLFPLHTWLPDAHVEAPTAGSVMLASVMLKMGTYGLVRFCLPLFPNASRENAGWIVALAVVGIIYGALVAMVQPNMKKLVAYSSVSHLGFVVLGIFSFNQLGLDGAVYQMLNHGVSTGALFILVGYLYERRHSLEIVDYGGVATAAPWLATIFLITTLASIGLPTLNNFVGEFLVLQGASLVNFQWSVFAAIGVILSACYMLWLYQRTFFGRMPGQSADSGNGHGHAAANPVAHEVEEQTVDGHGHDAHSHWHMPDLSVREWVAILPLVILMVWMGMGSQSFLPSIGVATARTLEQSKSNIEYQVKTPADSNKTQPVAETANAR
jgi:NADH-quinone oxidoreductase subunit M